MLFVPSYHLTLFQGDVLAVDLICDELASAHRLENSVLAQQSMGLRSGILQPSTTHIDSLDVMESAFGTGTALLPTSCMHALDVQVYGYSALMIAIVSGAADIVRCAPVPCTCAGLTMHACM